jgi:PTH1 family peptidyl-tRNA hydrolase
VKDISELLVVVDDVDLELGRLRVRERGSAGGHNGLKSIAGALGSEEFARLRIGTGPRPNGADMVEYVLESFLPGEREIVGKALECASRCVEAWITGGIEGARAEITNVS